LYMSINTCTFFYNIYTKTKYKRHWQSRTNQRTWNNTRCRHHSVTSVLLCQCSSAVWTLDLRGSLVSAHALESPCFRFPVPLTEGFRIGVLFPYNWNKIDYIKMYFVPTIYKYNTDAIFALCSIKSIDVLMC